MSSLVYFVKQEVGLFRKGTWNIMLDRQILGMHKEQQAALDAALSEAERTSLMGRTTEVWVYEGDGFVLKKAFLAQRPRGDDKDKKEGDDDDPAFLDADPNFDGATADPTMDPTLY